MARNTYATVAALADDVDWAPSDLLTCANPKTAKSEGYGYLTAILHLAPHKASGANLCAWATTDCILACLNTSGQGGIGTKKQTVQRARIRKSKWFRADRNGFMQRLERDIARHVATAEAHGLIPCVRLNGTSDIPWERVRFFSKILGRIATIFQVFPFVQFYDYTKGAIRFAKKLPSNYDLTMSQSASNGAAVAFARKHGARVAKVFRNARKPNARAAKWELPALDHDGTPIVDGDRHDLRFLDPPGCIVGLKAKGLATRDELGFVTDIDPA